MQDVECVTGGPCTLLSLPPESVPVPLCMSCAQFIQEVPPSVSTNGVLRGDTGLSRGPREEERGERRNDEKTSPQTLPPEVLTLHTPTSSSATQTQVLSAL